MLFRTLIGDHRKKDKYIFYRELGNNWLPSNRVISSPFSHRTFFSQNFMKVPYIFFLTVNSLKKWFRCWHGNFWPWLTSKSLFFFILLQVTKVPSWRVISSAPYIPGLKHEFKPLQVISSAENILKKI